MDFKRDFLINELCLPDRAIEDNIYDSSRWTEEREIIFKHGDKHCRTYYSVGATEMQYVDPCEDEEVVSCQEVELKEVTTTVWIARRVKMDNIDYGSLDCLGDTVDVDLNKYANDYGSVLDEVPDNSRFISLDDFLKRGNDEYENEDYLVDVDELESFEEWVSKWDDEDVL